MGMRIIDNYQYQAYNDIWREKLPNALSVFQFSETEVGEEYQIQSSAVFSSNIEGNSIDLNSYMNSKLAKEKFKPTKELKEIDDLVKAYFFAKNNSLTEKNFLYCHQLLSEELLIKSLRGAYRNDKVGVFSPEGLVYLAVEEHLVVKEMSTLFSDIEELIKKDLSVIETFYYASMIHLRLAHIHPFRDGNGRAARLLEKWFLAQKLGVKFWQIPSEKYYKTHQSQYYQNLNLGFDFYALDYERSLLFLNMLPNTLINN